MKGSNNLSISIIIVSFLIMTTLLTSCYSPYDSRYSFKSNGERIYFTAQSSSGDSISYKGGIGMMMKQRIACASCHGSNGKGGTVRMMMTQLDVPDITWDKLTEEFTEEEIKVIITEGVEPDGEHLDTEMPRWQMSERDLNDLVSFLKTLK